MIQSIAGDGWTVRALARSAMPGRDEAATQPAAVSDTPEGIVGKRFAATVPGCVHDALLAAGAIQDPDEGDGEPAQEWVGRTAWGWHRNLDLGERARSHDRIDLVFESIDTCGSVWLNGRCLGHVENQFRPWRFDVRGIVRTLGNSVGGGREAPPGDDRPGASTDPG